MSKDPTFENLMDQLIKARNAFVEQNKGATGLLDWEGMASQQNNVAIYGGARFLDLMMVQPKIQSCWMNVGLKGFEDYTKSCEALFLSMFEGQEKNYLSRTPLTVLDTSSGYGDQYLTLSR